MINKMKMKLTNFSNVQLITSVFLSVILIGTVLLKLPISSNYQQKISWINALFVATSATCVTGLSPVVIHEQFNSFGQAIILILIEIGGIGFMSIPVLFYFFKRKQVYLSTRLLLRESMNVESKSGEFRLALSIIKISLFIQAVGTLLLSYKFVPKYGVKKGIWYSVFHSVSAFCNAGFDLFGDSLVGFKNSPLILISISLLIISGGIGFIVWNDLIDLKSKRLSLQSKLTLVMSIILLFIGFLFYTRTVNYQGSLIEYISQLLFLSSTPRTAGFYTINYDTINQSGLMMTMILMFIGGSPGSTAGGIKTTTLAVLLLKVKSMLNGKKRTEVFNRTIKEQAVSKAMVIFFIALTLCTISILLLSITENINLIKLIFEVISAFGTVGLTMGITAELSLLGKLIIICLMFIGRIGTLTILLSLYGKSDKRELKIKYPEEIIMLG